LPSEDAACCEVFTYCEVKKLKSFYEKYELKEEAEWVAARLKKIEG
tara:strand:+ start:84 stop:221 length:138 start_codon:yes stop_codon:yes gene_type:complete